MKKIIVSLSLSIVFLIPPSKVFAQSLSLSLSPPIVEIMVKPGKALTQSFTLSNQGEDSLISFQIVPFDKNGLILDKLSESIPWMEVISPKLNFILKKGESIEAVLKINPPENTPEQDYYQALIFKSSPPPQGRYSEMRIQQSISALIFTSVTSRGLPKKAQITNFVVPSIQDSFSPLKIGLKVKNTGKTYFHPKGNIMIKGALGQIKYPILPRLFMVDQERELMFDKKDGGIFSGLFLGRYLVKVSFTLDDGNIKIEEEKTIYSFPYKLSLILAILLILYYLIRKKKFQKSKLAVILFFCLIINLIFPEKTLASTDGINIKAVIDFGSYLRLYGFTSPDSTVYAEGIRAFGMAKANNLGYFEIDSLALARETKEICIISTDSENRISQPLCLPVSPVHDKQVLGPVILPPTISLSHSILNIGQTAYASGQSLPSSSLDVFLFNSRSIKNKITLLTDNQGKYTLRLPTKNPLSWRIFTLGFNRDHKTIPKSLTLFYKVNTPLSFLYFALPIFLWLGTILSILTALYYYNRKTGKLKESYDLIQKRLQPQLVRLFQKQKLVLYNFRGFWRQYHK